MSTDTIQFLEEIPIDERHTLHQLLGRFQTVRDGLPELVKNAKDQYARLGGPAPPERRPIVILVDSANERLGVLDFAGATRADFDHWMVWSDPGASRIADSADIEGRHGNGGKGFMVRGSTRSSSLESVTGGVRTKMGFQNDSLAVQYYPGFFVEDGLRVDELTVDDVSSLLSQAIEPFGIGLDDLPDTAWQVFERSQSFTLARVDGVRDWVTRPESAVSELIGNLRTDLEMHAQAALTLETCTVYLVLDGRQRRKPLERELPEPLQSFEKPWRLHVPERLTDPETGTEVSTGGGTKREKYLHLHTSARSLRMPGRRPLNVIRVCNARNVLASWSIADLYPHAESAFVYGELRVPALELDHIAGADRTTLADTDLVRALKEWVSEQIAEMCRAIQKAMAEDYTPADRRRVNRELAQFRRLMGEFLDKAGPARPLPGVEGTDEAVVDEETPEDPDEEEKNNDDEPDPIDEDIDEDDIEEEEEDEEDDEEGAESTPEEDSAVHAPAPASLTATRPRRRRFRIISIDLEPDRERISVAAGTRVPLVVRAVEVDQTGVRRMARNTQLELVEDGGPVVELDPNGNVLHALEPGEVDIAVRDPRTGITSPQSVTVEVIHCAGARIENVPQRLLAQGERWELAVIYETESGPRRDLLVQAWLDEPEMGRVDRRACFTAGRYPGDVQVRVRYGPREGQTVAAELEIGSEMVADRPVRRIVGGRIPHILVCGTAAPGMEQFPPDQRTVRGGPHEPTIIDFEPQFEHVIWVNPSSEESVRVREGRGGSRGVAGIGTKPYLRFLAIKCFEILKRLHVRQRIEDRPTTAAEFRRLFAQAEIACVPFFDTAYSVAESLAQTGDGTLR